MRNPFRRRKPTSTRFRLLIGERQPVHLELPINHARPAEFEVLLDSEMRTITIRNGDWA